MNRDLFCCRLFLAVAAFLSATALNAADPTAISFAPGSVLVAEGAGPVPIEILRDRFTEALTVTVTVGGTANEGADFATIARSVVFVPGQVSATVQFTALADGLVEGAETVLLGLAPGTYVPGAVATCAITIVDTDVVATATLADPTAMEGDSDRASLLITWSPPLSTVSALAIDLAGSFTPGSDGRLVLTVGSATSAQTTIHGEVVLPVGTTSAELRLEASADGVVEGSESAQVTLHTLGAFVFSGNALAASTELAVIDADTVASIRALGDAGEGGVDGAFAIELTQAMPVDLVIPLGWSGTATGGVDTSPLPTAATIPAGATSVILAIHAVADALDEGAETVTAALLGGRLVRTDPERFRATLRIVDVQGTASLTAIADGNEAGPVPARLLAALDRPASVPVDLAFVLSGSASSADLVVPDGKVRISAGATSAQLVIPIRQDALAEADESVVVSLIPGAGYAIGGNATCTVVVHDDEPAVTISALEDAVEGAGAGRFRLSLSAPLPIATLIELSFTGLEQAVTDRGATVAGVVLDPATSRGTLSVPAGAATAAFTVALASDAVRHPVGPLTVTVAQPADDQGRLIRYRSTAPENRATIRLIDDEPVPVTVASDGTASEHANTARFLVTCNEGDAAVPGRAVVLRPATSGSATAGADYAPLPATVTLAADAHQVAVPITVLDDQAAEGPETIEFRLLADPAYTTTGGSATAALTITDDDRPVVRLAVPVTNVREPRGSAPVEVRISAPLTADLAVTVAIDPASTVASSSDIESLPTGLTIAAGSTTAGFLVKVLPDTQPENPELLVLRLGESDAYTVDPASASATVTVRDALGAGEFDLVSEPASPLASLGSLWSYDLGIRLPEDRRHAKLVSSLAPLSGVSATPGWLHFSDPAPLDDLVRVRLEGTPPLTLEPGGLRVRIRIAIDGDGDPAGDTESILMQDLLLLLAAPATTASKG